MRQHRLPVLMGVAAATIVVVSCGVTQYVPSVRPDTIRLVTYNVGAFHKYPSSTIVHSVRMMKELGADAISLNELDSCNLRGGLRVFQLEKFADKMGEWQYKWGQAINYGNGGYGIGVAVSPKYKVVDKWTIQLPKSDDKEVRSLTAIETEEFVFCSTHLGLTDKSRADQMARIDEEIARRYPAYGKPVFLCGDFNAEPDSDLIKSLSERWERLTGTDVSYSTRDPHKCIDYIFLYRSSAPVTVIDTRVCYEFQTFSPQSASDHFPVYLEVKLNDK